MNLKLDQLTLFLLIIEKGSLAGAGRALGVSATTISDRLSALESYYGVTLLNRTTRAIHLTEEGRTFLEGARHLLSEAEALDARVRLGARTLSGLIRVSAPISIGHAIVEPIVNEFLESNPNVSIELLLTDSYLNVIDEGIDMAIRLGNLSDSSLRSRRLGVNQRVVCASPDYLEQHGIPNKPNELLEHNCLVMRFGSQLDNVWSLQASGKVLPIRVEGNRVANDGRLVHEWCRKGYGVALKSLWDVAADLEAGKLVQLLSEYSPLPAAVNLLFPPSRSQALRVREFAKVVVGAFQRDS